MTTPNLPGHRLAGALAPTVLVVSALGACGSADPGTAPSPKPTVVDVSYEVLPPTDPQVEIVLAGRGLSGRTPRPVVERAAEGGLLLVTWGSSSCPAVPVAAAWTGDELALSIEDLGTDVPAGEPVACTADLGPTVVAFDVGDLPGGAFTVDVDGQAVVEVAASS